MLKTTGIHHISSVVGHAQRNVDFYASVLGLRLVKKTVNFDDKDRYHLYYGNANGNTGLTTTFPFSDGDEGFVGAGQVGVTAYATSSNAFVFWKARLAAFNIPYFEYERFGKKRIGFTDPDGLELELIENGAAKRLGGDAGAVRDKKNGALVLLWESHGAFFFRQR